ncbi:hypothetical protein [Actinophytocola sp.]|uniref:hypothetical protein n=1 Tax=Actinophytocola sp. TaxID=1872138 RepID=UPI0025B9BD14|nr:hypothetical protein [Actinophytocola sp.]
MAGFLAKYAGIAASARETVGWLNGEPAARIDIGGEINTAVSVVVENGRITRLYAVQLLARGVVLGPLQVAGPVVPVAAAHLCREPAVGVHARDTEVVVDAGLLAA